MQDIKHVFHKVCFYKHHEETDIKSILKYKISKTSLSQSQEHFYYDICEETKQEGLTFS